MLFLPLLCAKPNEDDEKIVVKLATESKLLPLYLAPFYKENPNLDVTYIQQLEQVLLFDLNHNGMTYTVKHTGEQDALLGPGGLSFSGHSAQWKALNVFYVIKILIKDKQISAHMLSVNGNNEKSVEGLPFTGNISQDRRQIHHLADIIHKALFDLEGVANTRIIYTVTTIKGKNSTAEIWEADYDGANARQITKENCLCVTYVYPP